jgi:hypothetical protein
MTPEVVHSKEYFIERLANKYKGQTITFRDSEYYQYALLFTGRSNNLMIGVFDTKKDIGKIFDRRQVDRE